MPSLHNAARMALAHIEAMQRDAVAYLTPDDTGRNRDWFVSRMLWQLDGPEQRTMQDALRAALPETRFTTCCHVAILSDQRYCPKCGWEASVTNSGSPICE